MQNYDLDLVDIHSLCTDIIEETQCHSPERKLLAHLLERAILDLRHQDKYVRKEAEQWFFAEGDNYIFSFENVCEFLDLDIDNMLVLLKRWIVKQGLSCSN